MFYLPPAVFNIIKDFANFNPRKALIKDIENFYKNCKYSTVWDLRKKLNIVEVIKDNETVYVYKAYSGRKLIRAPVGWVKQHNPDLFRSDKEFFSDDYYRFDCDRKHSKILKVSDYYTNNNFKRYCFINWLRRSTVKELKQFCRDNKIKGFSKLRSQELVSLIIKKL
jgi:hypothetical protein